MEYRILLKYLEHINHNVVRLITEKPENYKFTPGQATELSIDKEGWKNEKRPFTFTSLPEDDELEFTIKIYPSHDGVTEQIEKLEVGDYLFIGDSWGAINYKGKGSFIAGGAGITPFIAILKDLNKKGELSGNKLFFGNHQEKDIIYKNNLQEWLGNDLFLILSEGDSDAFDHGRINQDYLEKNGLETTRPVYLCGPPPMMDAVESDLYRMGVSKSNLIKEE